MISVAFDVEISQTLVNISAMSEAATISRSVPFVIRKQNGVDSPI